MNKLFLIITFIVSVNVNAQVENKFRVGLELGYVSAEKTDFGLNFSLEPKYNIKKNMNIGLRIESVAAFRGLLTYNNKTSAFVYSNASFMGTFDYYFDKSSSNFVPFVGGGIGISSFENKFVSDINDNKQTEAIDPKSGIGVLFRSGFEWGKFRFSLNYNFIPSSNVLTRNNYSYIISDPSDPAFRRNDISFSNSYLSVNVGFFIGGGKWKNISK